MKFEASSARHIIRDAKDHHVAFQPGPKRNEAGDQFGEFNTGGKGVPENCGFKTEEDLIAFIQGSGAYKSKKIGVRGIWRYEDRIALETSVDHKTARTAVVVNMTEPQLRAIIGASNVGVPGEGVPIEELQDIAVKCLAGTIAAGTVIEPKVDPKAAAPVEGDKEEVETEDAGKSKGNGKDKKK